MRPRPAPTSSATPTLGIKSNDSVHSVSNRCLGALEYTVSADEIQTLAYQLCHTYARY